MVLYRWHEKQAAKAIDSRHRKMHIVEWTRKELATRAERFCNPFSYPQNLRSDVAYRKGRQNGTRIRLRCLGSSSSSSATSRVAAQ